MSVLPDPTPVWTAWPAVSGEVPMARVKLDVGQYSFQAGAQYDPSDHDDFARKVRRLIDAISSHARSRNWIR